MSDVATSPVLTPVHAAAPDLTPSRPVYDGKLRELRVKVSRNGATVRSRLWVRVPKKIL